MNEEYNNLKMTWGSWLFECMWPEHDTNQQALKDLIYEDAGTLTRDIDSDVAINHKKHLIEPKLDFFVKYNQDQRLFPLIDYLDYQVRSVYHSLCNSHANREWPQDINVYFRDSWYHITKDRGYHDVHNHGNSSFCGIYYLDIGESQHDTMNGVNKFFTPFMPSTDESDFGYHWWPSETVNIVPKNGKIVLFPGYLMHNATPYTGDTDRIVVAFNSQIKAKGDVGLTFQNLLNNLPIST